MCELVLLFFTCVSRCSRACACERSWAFVGVRGLSSECPLLATHHMARREDYEDKSEEFQAFVAELTRLRPWDTQAEIADATLLAACEPAKAEKLHELLSHDFPDVRHSDLESLVAFLVSQLREEDATTSATTTAQARGLSRWLERRFIDGIVYGATINTQRSAKLVQRDASRSNEASEEQNHDSRLESDATRTAIEAELQHHVQLALAYTKLCGVVTLLLPFHIIKYDVLQRLQLFKCMVLITRHTEQAS